MQASFAIAPNARPPAHIFDILFLWLYARRLRRRLAHHGPSFAKAIRREFEARAEALVFENTRRVVDRASGSHLWMSATVTATYQVLRSHPQTRDEALEVTRDVWLGTAAGPPAWAMRLLPKIVTDPFRFVVNVSKAKRAKYYGVTFERRDEQDDDDAYRMTVLKCFYHRFLLDHGVPELGPMFCAKDFDWAGALDPATHRFSFARPTTLLTGGSCCTFELRRVRRLPVLDSSLPSRRSREEASHS